MNTELSTDIKMNASARMTNIESEAVVEFRKRIAPKQWLDPKKLNSDNFLLRYIRASKFNLDKGEKMIKWYVDYIQAQKDDPATILRTIFPPDFQASFKAYVGGRDYEGRPLVMFPDIMRWNLKQIIQSGNEEMFITFIHKAGLMMEEEIQVRDADYGLCICDVGNIPYANYFHRRTIEIQMHLVSHMEKCAPGVIKRVYIVNAPKLWIAFFSAVQAMLALRAEVTTFDSNSTNWRAKLREIIPEDGICKEFGGTCTKYAVV